jgi:fructose-bisphosphate aldolase, class II
MKKVVAQRMREFGQAGHDNDYAAIPLSEMAKGYASGKLDTRPSMAGAR